MPKLGKVHGVVKLDGKPLEAAHVEFSSAKASPSVGVTDSSGAYTLDYDASHKGAAVGEYSVRITTKPGGALGEGKEEKVPSRYNAQTELKATVKEGDNTVDFDLQSK